jgi:TolB-like protein/tRNA A-37 threonylcarbamoyl transferase component Bud32/Tfp pilus assembly protein PilF
VRDTVRRRLMNKATAPSDSVADVIGNLAKCPRCGVVTRLDHGTCISCLLREGLETKGEASREAFESILSEANVTDTQWRLGHYEILEEIGRGGMGVIYRARQQHSRRIVAVKRILAHQVNSHETLVRFRREAEAVASLDHPNILPIHEVSESEEGLPFFSMKYAEGGSLRAAAPALRTKPRDCVRLMAKVARGIAYAHGKGVLHRDLQPGNILLDENSEPMVSDFGLAKWLNETSDLTRTLETLGTPGYIAPEQAECRTADLTGAADIYSLGAILFYLLAGRPPFVGPNVLSVIHQAAATPAPRLRSLAPSLDRDLETIVGHCLESDPAARYESAGALADDLDHWLRHEPIQARRVGIFTRGGKWVRRNPTSAALVASLVALAAAIGVMFWEKESQHLIATGNAAIPDKSIAVLPFENLGEEKEHAFFADGVQDDILIKLAKIADLKVISRTSVMQYRGKQNVREIGNALHVSHVLEGTVRRSGGKVHVNAQLVDARTDAGIWAEEYDRDLNDVFAVETEVAQSIANRLRAKVSAREKVAMQEWPTRDLAAYDLYLRAKPLIDFASESPPSAEKNLSQAVDLLNQAIARDPAFLLAYCRLAQAHDDLYFQRVDHTPRRLALAKAAIDSAFRLKPDSGEAHLALALHLYRGYLDYDHARDELALAARTLPNNAWLFELTGYIDRRHGRWPDAVRNLKRADELDPRDVHILTGLATTYLSLRDYKQLRNVSDRMQALDPANISPLLYRAWISVYERADTRPVHAAIEKILAGDPAREWALEETRFWLAWCERDFAAAERALPMMTENGNTFNIRGVNISRACGEGLIARVRGDLAGAKAAFTAARAEQEKRVREDPDHVGALCVLGLIDAGLGRKDQALQEGRQAVERLPVAKNALDDPNVLYLFAIICAWTGERDLAIEQLQTLVRIPLLTGTTYGELRLDPWWDPLRGDPRFEKIVEEAKKPVALK